MLTASYMRTISVRMFLFIYIKMFQTLQYVSTEYYVYKLQITYLYRFFKLTV